MTLLPYLVVALAALAQGANAQEEGLPLRGEGNKPAAVARGGDESDPFQFGTNWNTKVIPASAFVGKGSSSTYSVWPTDQYAYSTAGGVFWAPLDLPPGSEVQEMCVA